MFTQLLTITTTHKFPPQEFNQILEKIYHKVDVESVDFRTENGWRGSKSVKFMPMQGHCLVFKPESIATFMSRIQVRRVGLYRFYVADPNWSVFHRIAETPAMAGDSIIVAKANETHGLAYNFNIEIEQWVESVSELCEGYGKQNASFASYADCMEDYYRQQFQPVLGCTVPWLTATNQGWKLYEL